MAGAAGSGQAKPGGAGAQAGTNAALGLEGEKPHVDVTLPTAASDLDNAYTDAWELLRQPAEDEGDAKKKNSAARAKDYYATIRSRVLLVWIMSNCGLAVGICIISKVHVQIMYMGVLLYSAAAIAAIKLTGTIIYLYVISLHASWLYPYPFLDAILVLSRFKFSSLSLLFSSRLEWKQHNL